MVIFRSYDHDTLAFGDGVTKDLYLGRRAGAIFVLIVEGKLQIADPETYLLGQVVA